MKRMAVEKELARLRHEVGSLEIELENTKTLAHTKERVLVANVHELEQIYRKLTEALAEVRHKGHEIEVLNALNEIIATASRHLILGEVLGPTLEVIIESIKRLLFAGGHRVEIGGGVFIMDEESSMLRLAATSGVDADTLGCGGSVAPGECLCGKAAETGSLVSSTDCLKDPRHSLMHPAGKPHEHSHVTIPLKSGEKVTGLIFLYIMPPGYVPGKEDQTFFSAIGNYLGLHIEKAMLYERVQNLATRDPLTGTFNRREFMRHLEMELDRARRTRNGFCILMIDIDHFKQINDTLGHQAGDEVLTAFGGLLTRSMRGMNVTARYGGEEFAVILQETTLEEGIQAAERIRHEIESHGFKAGDRTLNLTASIGVASSGPAPDAQRPEELIRSADRALYRAKKDGRNAVRYEAGAEAGRAPAR